MKPTSLDLPKPGQSYNPAAEDHEVLLNRAIEELQKDEEQRQKELDWKKAWDAGAKEARGKGVDEFEDLVGLKVARGDDAALAEEEEEEDEEESDAEDDKAVKEMKRKTKQQKAKAKKIKEEIRARLQAKASKRSMSDLQSLRSFKRQLIATELEIKQMAEKRRLAREKKNQDRVGVYKLPKRQEEVQLGEDLAEGLRTLKVGARKQCVALLMLTLFAMTARGQSAQRPGTQLPEARHRRAKAKGHYWQAQRSFDAGKEGVRSACLQEILLMYSVRSIAALPSSLFTYIQRCRTLLLVLSFPSQLSVDNSVL